MNNKIIYGIIYGIIILCILFIILVFVFSTGNKVADLFLVGILAISVYLINKNIADDKDLYPEIYNKIATDRDIAITNTFINEFQKYFKGPPDEIDKTSENYVLGQIKNEEIFEDRTKNYLNNLNNEVSIEEYFEHILSLFNDTEYNKDDLKKNIIKYVVFFYFPEYNKKGVVKPLNYKKLVYLYIKDNTDINNEMIENIIKYYVDIVLETVKVKVLKPDSKTFKNVKNAQIIINYPLARTELRIAYSTLKTNDEKKFFINYINKLLGNYNKKVGITDFIADKITAKVAPDSTSTGAADDKNLDPKIYIQIAISKSFALKSNFNEEFKKYFKDPNNKTNEYSSDDVLEQIEQFDEFLSNTKNYLNNNELSIENYFNEILPLFNYTEDNKDDLKKDIIKYVVFYYLPNYIKPNGAIPPPNYEILVNLYIKNKIKNDVDYILQKQRIYWNKLDATNLEAMNENATTQLNVMYNDYLTQYEKDVLIAYINELLKDVEEKDVEEKIKKITELRTLNNFMFN